MKLEVKTFLSAGCLLLSVVAGTAHASLISINDPFYGVGSVTRDNNSGLDWLDLTKSLNLSVNGIQAGAGGFLAQGFQVATLTQVEAMYTSGGWDGVDGSASIGTAANYAFVQSMHNLFGVTGFEGDGSPFSEGWALSSVPNTLARLFNTLPIAGGLGRVACTSAGFTAFPNLNVFSGCRMDEDQHYNFIGTYLVRPSSLAPVPEPATFILLGSTLSVVAFARLLKKRS